LDDPLTIVKNSQWKKRMEKRTYNKNKKKVIRETLLNICSKEQKPSILTNLLNLIREYPITDYSQTVEMCDYVIESVHDLCDYIINTLDLLPNMDLICEYIGHLLSFVVDKKLSKKYYLIETVPLCLMININCDVAKTYESILKYFDFDIDIDTDHSTSLHANKIYCCNLVELGKCMNINFIKDSEIIPLFEICKNMISNFEFIQSMLFTQKINVINKLMSEDLAYSYCTKLISKCFVRKNIRVNLFSNKYSLSDLLNKYVYYDYDQFEGNNGYNSENYEDDIIDVDNDVGDYYAELFDERQVISKCNSSKKNKNNNNNYYYRYTMDNYGRYGRYGR